MKRVLFTALGLAPAMSGADLVPGGAGGPTIATPGTATWNTEPIDSGTRTTYTITGDTIFNWPELNLPTGDELVFDFIGGDTIANLLGPGGFHSIDGSVISNGNVGFFAPNANLSIGGSITARSVTVATLGVDAADFLDGGDLTMSGTGAGMLSVGGELTATNGDVVVAGGFVVIDGAARLSATQAVRVAASHNVAVAGSGENRLNAEPGSGFVLNLGQANAATIEISAGTAITNGGLVQAGNGTGRIFLEVGAGGKITNEGTGLIIGNVSAVGTYVDDGVTLRPDEGDAAVAVNPSALKIPALRRPDGSRFARERLVSNHAPMTASADSVRDRNGGSVAVARVEKASLMKRASFFGMRGGKSPDKSDKSR